MDVLRKYSLAIIAGSVGVAISVGVFFVVAQQERETTRDALSRAAMMRIDLVRGRIENELLGLRATAGFFASRLQEDRDGFAMFASTLRAGRDDVLALEWVPVVAREERADYERRARADGIKGFSITQRAPDGALVLADKRDVYYPVYYIEPFAGNEVVLGFDLGSDPILRIAMDQARDSGKVVASARVELAQFATKRGGVLLFAPVYTYGARHDTVLTRRASLKGFAVQAVRLSALFAPPTASAGVPRVRLVVRDENAGGKRLYADPLASGMTPGDSGFAQTLIEGGRSLRLAVYAHEKTGASIPSSRVWLVSGVPLSLSILLCGILISNARKRDEIIDTVRQRTEDLRRATMFALDSEHRANGIIENMSEGLIMIDQTGKIETFNAAAERMFGYTEAEVLGLDVSLLMPRKERKNHQEYIHNSQLYAPRIINRARDLKGLRKDGTAFDVELNVAHLHLEGGGKFVGIMRDVSERKLGETALRDSEERFRDYTETASDWIWETDRNLRLTFVSDQFFSITHMRPDDIIGKARWELETPQVGGADGETWAAHRADMENHRSFRDFRYRIKNENVQEYDLSLNGKPVFAEDGVFVGYRGTGANITDLVKAEEEMRQAKEEAEAANRAKSEFLSSMSHELRTPLNAILGFGQLLESDDREPLGEIQKKSINHILSSGRHLLGLINDVLDLAKIESGDVALSLENVSPGAVVAECVDMAVSMGAARQIKIENRCSLNSLPLIRADLMRFRQVLLNFLSNAVKYNRDGGRVVLGCTRLEDGFLRFSINDTGMGLSDKQQAELFRPFNRLGMEASAIEGTGIGLVITRELVSLMNGRLGMKSTLGHGSTFWFDLPISIRAHESLFTRGTPYKSHPNGLDVKAQDVTSGAAQGSVLYIEDNPANMALMERLFDLFPAVSLSIAQNAEDGLSLARTAPPTLVLMDINLPGMDGFEAVKALHDDALTAGIPVVAVSANAMPRDIQRALEAGFVRYLTKPIDVGEVVDVVNAYIRAAGEVL